MSDRTAMCPILSKLLVRRLCLAGALLFFAAPRVEAQFQRMAIGGGSYALAPRQGTSVDAYCLDFTRDSPTAQTRYTDLLSDPGSAQVRLADGTTMPFQEATRKGLVEIRGNDLTVSRLLSQMNEPAVRSRLPRNARKQLDQMAKMWKAASPEERADAEKELAPLMELLGGDHSSLSVVNNTDQNIEFVVDGTAEFGGSGDSAVAAQVTGNQHDTPQQRKLWTRRTKRHEEMLKATGSYTGAIADKIDDKQADKLKAAVAGFQRKNHLEATGKIDSVTEAALEDRYYGQLIVPQGQAAQIYSLGFEQQQYVLRNAGSVLYQGNNAADLTTSLLKTVPDPGGKTFYIDTSAMEPAKAEALVTSVRVQAPVLEKEVSIRSMRRNAGAAEAPLDLIRRGPPPAIGPEAFSPVSRGEPASWHQAEATIRISKGNRLLNGVLRVVGKTKELVSGFFGRVRGLLGGVAGGNLADIAAKARDELRNAYQFTDDELRVYIHGEFGELQIVERIVKLLSAMMA